MRASSAADEEPSRASERERGDRKLSATSATCSPAIPAGQLCRRDGQRGAAVAAQGTLVPSVHDPRPTTNAVVRFPSSVDFFPKKIVKKDRDCRLRRFGHGRGHDQTDTRQLSRPTHSRCVTLGGGLPALGLGSRVLPQRSPRRAPGGRGGVPRPVCPGLINARARRWAPISAGPAPGLRRLAILNHAQVSTNACTRENLLFQGCAGRFAAASRPLR